MKNPFVIEQRESSKDKTENRREINLFLIKYYLLGMFGAMYFIGPFIMIIVNQNIPNAFHITILLSMYSIVKIVFEIPSGAFADRFGRKNTLILSELLWSLAFIFFLLRRDYFDFLMTYFLIGLWSTLQSGTIEAFLYDNMKKLGIVKDYAKYEARKSAVELITYSLSSVAASYMILFGYNFVIILTIIFSSFCSLLVVMTIKDTNRIDKNIAKLNTNYWKIAKNGFRYSFRHRTVLKFIIFIVFINSFVFLVNNYYELILFHITQNLSLVPILLAIGAGYCALCQFFITKHFQQTRVFLIIIGAIIFSIIPVLIGFIFYKFPISYILFLIFWGSLYVFLSIMNAKKQVIIPSRIRATVNSVEGFWLGVVSVIYLLFFGKLVEILSYKTGFIIVSGITLIIVTAFVFILGFDKHLKRKESRMKNLKQISEPKEIKTYNKLDAEKIDSLEGTQIEEINKKK